MLDRIDGERYRGQHEQHRGDGRRFGERRGRASRAKCSLTALSAEGCRYVSRLAALQEDDNDKKQANHYVDDCHQNDHGI